MCRFALDTKYANWEKAGTVRFRFVEEAIRRQLSESDCRGLTTHKQKSIVASLLPIGESIQNIEGVASEYVCRAALAPDKLNWEYNDAFTTMVKEAKRRNMTVDSCRQLLGFSPLRSEGEATAEMLTFDNRIICVMSFEQAIGGKNGYRLKPDSDVYVTHMKRRSLTEDSCRELLGI